MELGREYIQELVKRTEEMVEAWERVNQMLADRPVHGTSLHALMDYDYASKALDKAVLRLQQINKSLWGRQT